MFELFESIWSLINIKSAEQTNKNWQMAMDIV